MTPLLYLAAGIVLGCVGFGVFGVVSARTFARGLRRELADRLRDHEHLLRESLAERDPAPTIDEARLTQRVQQAVQVEIEYLAQQQLARDEALAQKQRRWHAEQRAHNAMDLQLLLDTLEARGGKAVTHGVATMQPTSPRTAPVAAAPTHSATALARPPESTPVPVPRADIAPEAERPELELSDEEIDALPPELPTLAKPRKRVLPAPRKPPLQSI